MPSVRERWNYYANLGEDGWLAWKLYVLRRCWHGHAWVSHPAGEGEDGYRDCSRCGMWGGWL